MEFEDFPGLGFCEGLKALVFALFVLLAHDGDEDGQEGGDDYEGDGGFDYGETSLAVRTCGSLNHEVSIPSREEKGTFRK